MRYHLVRRGLPAHGFVLHLNLKKFWSIGSSEHRQETHQAASSNDLAGLDGSSLLPFDFQAVPTAEVICIKGWIDQLRRTVFFSSRATSLPCRVNRLHSTSWGVSDSSHVPEGSVWADPSHPTSFSSASKSIGAS